MTDYYISFWQTHFELALLSVSIIALMIGSFLNVVIYRLPIMMMQEWRAQCSELFNTPINGVVNGTVNIPNNNPTAIFENNAENDVGNTTATSPKSNPALTHKIFNLSLPRSHCPHCSHQLSWWQNIPLLSYLLLKGQCQFCQKSISLRYPLVEFLSLGTSLLLAWHFGITLQFIAALLFTWVLLPLIFIDLAEQILPDTLTLSLLWLGLLCNMGHLFTDINSAIIGTIVGYLFLWIIAWSFHKITGKQGLGLGDCKLLAALGAWTGWQLLPLILLFASLLGSVIAISLISLKKLNRDTPIPFGPYLALSGWLGLLWGNQIMQWYVTVVI